MEQKDKFIKSYFTVTKGELFDLLVEVIVANKKITKEEAYDWIYDYSVKVKKAKKVKV